MPDRGKPLTHRRRCPAAQTQDVARLEGQAHNPIARNPFAIASGQLWMFLNLAGELRRCLHELPPFASRSCKPALTVRLRLIATACAGPKASRRFHGCRGCQFSSRRFDLAGSPTPAPPGETNSHNQARPRHDARVHDWPASPGEIPSPQLVAAWLTLGTLPAERIPLWAAYWIAAGYDGDTLAQLAGLHGDDPHEVRDLLPAALAECGVSTPADPSQDHERAAAMVAFTAIARLQASGRASERWVVDKVVQVTAPHSFKPLLTSLPLGKLFALDDEWRAGWGRTDEQLREAVRQACARQLEAARV
jgi:hypothetical protein